VRGRTLLVATYNKGKLAELRDLLADLPLTILELDSFPTVEPIAETGQTFAENATLKASGYAKQTGLLALADDSGLKVDALDGAPGVLSARYGGPGASDSDRTSKLLSELSGVAVEARTARFVSVIAIADEGGQIVSLFKGKCEGRIADAPSGSRGFGYDPIFIPDGFNKTFGELEPKVKNRISHRARALAQACEFLRSLTVSPGAR
jgi:XTP/dITP diphosphohydrolase